MIDGSYKAGSGRNACLSDTPSWIYQLLIQEPQASFSYMIFAGNLGIASELSWFQCLSSICIVKFAFNMSPQSSSKWHIYSYIPIYKDQIYCYQYTAKPCRFRLQFWLNSISSPLNVFSDITLKCFCLKKASFGNTVIIKAQNSMCADWGINDMICFIQSS